MGVICVKYYLLVHLSPRVEICLGFEEPRAHVDTQSRLRSTRWDASVH